MKTMADHARAYRVRRSDKMARYEAALREITDLNITSDRNRPDEVVEDMVSIARQALSPTTGDDA